MKIFQRFVVLFLIWSSCALAQASNVGRAPTLALYNQECASCHMAYPPALLPAASWQRIMGNLKKHYGVDASVDASTQKTISTWLMNNAGTGKRARTEPSNDRITQAEWFLKEHNSHEIPASVWKRPSVGSASNCNACHTKAAAGDFNEDQIRIPK